MACTYQLHPNATAALIGVAVAFVCAQALGQDETTDTLPAKQPDESPVLAYSEARFALTTATRATVTNPDSGTAEETDAGPDSRLRTDPAGLHGQPPNDEAGATGASAAKNWMLGEWPPDAAAPDILWTGAAAAGRTTTPQSQPHQTTVRTSGQFGVEAAQLTPLTGGKQVFALELADGFTLAGVGSRRMWTERHRAFVLAAEAGWQLTPKAGLHLGYEVFQAPTGDVLPTDAGGDSIFARFQLRF